MPDSSSSTISIGDEIDPTPPGRYQVEWKARDWVSREYGSPMPFSVFFAIRDAVASLGGYRINPPLDAPATAEAILNAADAVRQAAAA